MDIDGIAGGSASRSSRRPRRGASPTPHRRPGRPGRAWAATWSPAPSSARTAGAVPDEREPPPARLVVAGRAGDHPPRRVRSVTVPAPQPPPVPTSPSTATSAASSWPAPIPGVLTAGSRRPSSRRTPGCTSWAGPTASRRGRRRAASAGALYGLRIGGLFAGESMVHLQRDGSKVALVGLVDLLRQLGGHAPRRAVGDTAPPQPGRRRRRSPGLPRAARRGARPAGGVTSTSGHPHGPGGGPANPAWGGRCHRGGDGSRAPHDVLADGSSKRNDLPSGFRRHGAGHRPSRSVPTPVVGA